MSNIPVRYSITFGFSTLLALLLSSCNGGNSYGSESVDSYQEVARPKTAEELRAELLEREQSNPSEYLAVTGKYWRNLVDQLVIEGDIGNNATLAKFKDPVVTVEWHSQTETLMGRESYKVYEFVQPSGSAHFKFKTNAPSEVKSIVLSVSEAQPVQ
jgi:hypothetical protein